ncbi:helix-turn-helix transcriptional regulator [Zooshikella sp. RANM57]|uniref:helix-turn-helix transcriptional regulator n=1 Tax=Zooshikella sp. RANM57 TaxID=3425863 RepID=UPI003D6FCF83
MDSTVTTSDGHWQARLTNPYLAPRETLYCLGLLSGKTDKAIARDHNIEPSSVSRRIKNAHYKLKTTNRAHLVAELIRLNVIRLKIPPMIAMLLAVFTINSVALVVNDNPNKPRQVRVIQRTSRRPEYMSLDDDYPKGENSWKSMPLFIS